MIGYRLDLTCGDCGGELHHRQHAVAGAAEASALARCGGCGHEWLLSIRLLRVPNPESTRRARHRAQTKELVSA